MSEEGSSRGHERNYKFTKNRLGGKWLLHAGHAYVLHRENKKSSVWTCSKKKTTKCGGAAKLDTKRDIVNIQTQHTPLCTPDFFKNEVRVVVTDLIDEVGINYDPVQKIVEKKLVELNGKGPSAEIPTYRSLKSSLYRSRNKELKVQKTSFREPAEVVIPEKFKPNLLIDCTDEEGNRIIIFVSPKGRTDIKNMHHYLCDGGTLDCCPKPFKQVYTIHGDINNANNPGETKIVPIFYVLLVNDTKITYVTMFQKIKESRPDFNPKKFTLDFEVATMSAIEDVFPEAVIHGGCVHFQSFSNLPQHEIEDDCLAVIENSLPAGPVFEVNNYSVDQWLESDDMIPKICCYKEQHRSTNLVKAWNHRLQRHLGPNPNLLSFLQMITTDIANYNTAQERLRFKATPIRKKKRRTLLNEQVIAKVTEECEKKHTTINDFLEKINKIVLDITPKKS